MTKDILEFLVSVRRADAQATMMYGKRFKLIVGGKKNGKY